MMRSGFSEVRLVRATRRYRSVFLSWFVFAEVASCLTILLTSSATAVECFQCVCGDFARCADTQACRSSCDARCRAKCGSPCSLIELPGDMPPVASRDEPDADISTRLIGLGCHSQIDGIDARYNSFAKVVGASVFVSARDVDWAYGNRDGRASIDEFEKFFAAHGFNRASDCLFRTGWQKIALFQKNWSRPDGSRELIVSHAAVSSKIPGWWESKLGRLDTLLHRLSSLEGERGLGTVARCFERRLSQ